jgi:hypothetical protein
MAQQTANNKQQTALEWFYDQITRTSWDYKTFEQAKQMEKEQMINFAEFVATYPDKNKNVNGEMLHAKSKYDGAERTVDLLEIFKSE